MSKIFKVVCIRNEGAGSLKVGGVYDAKREDESMVVVSSVYSFPIASSYFLRLPTEPKTCADMTMEEYLAMVCLASVQPKSVEFQLSAGDYTTSTGMMSCKASSTNKYRVKSEKSAKDVEIEAIEKEMRALSDRLAKVKEK